LRNPLLVCASVPAALLLAEGALRLAGFSAPMFFGPDEVAGTWHRPRVSGLVHNEGRAWVETNSEGMRDREYAVKKPAGTIRVAVLGDSMTEAMQVPIEMTFERLLERKMRSCTGRRVEVMNFGMSGFGTASELLTLRDRVWKYEPDAVLLAFFFGNDIRNNHPSLEQDPLLPYFVYQGDRLTLDDRFRERLKVSRLRSSLRSVRDWLTDHLRILQLYYRFVLTMKSRKKTAGAPGIPGTESGTDNQVFLAPTDKTWQEAWRVTEALILTMRDEVRAHKAEFSILVIPSGIQVHPDVRLREGFRQRIGAESLRYPTDRIEAVAREANIPVVSLVEAATMQNASSQKTVHGFANAVPGFGHLNEMGHQMAAEALAHRFCLASSR